MLATPGLVNCHHHLYQWATRGLAQEATLFEWLQELYPVWSHVDEEIERAAASAGLAALARSGCSTASDHHYLFPRDGGDLLGVEVEAAPRASACGSIRAAARWTSGAPTAACRPTTWSRTATRSWPLREDAIDRYHDTVAGRDGADRARALLAVQRHRPT